MTVLQKIVLNKVCRGKRTGIASPRLLRKGQLISRGNFYTCLFFYPFRVICEDELMLILVSFIKVPKTLISQGFPSHNLNRDRPLIANLTEEGIVT